MKTEISATFRAFLVEILVYALLVVGYFFLILHSLSDWLQELHLHHVTLYAAVSVAIIIGQAVLLDTTTTWLLRLIRRRSE